MPSGIEASKFQFSLSAIDSNKLRRRITTGQTQKSQDLEQNLISDKLKKFENKAGSKIDAAFLDYLEKDGKTSYLTNTLKTLNKLGNKILQISTDLEAGNYSAEEAKAANEELTALSKDFNRITKSKAFRQLADEAKSIYDTTQYKVSRQESTDSVANLLEQKTSYYGSQYIDLVRKADLSGLKGVADTLASIANSSEIPTSGTDYKAIASAAANYLSPINSALGTLGEPVDKLGKLLEQQEKDLKKSGSVVDEITKQIAQKLRDDIFNDQISALGAHSNADVAFERSSFS